MTGTVGTRGTEGTTQAVIRPSKGDAVRLTGPEAAQVAALGNALVTACGSRSGDALSVSSFELRQVDGMQAYWGRIVATGSSVALDTGAGRAPVPLAGAPSEWAGQAGASVWVAGRWAGDAFEVQSHSAVR